MAAPVKYQMTVREHVYGQATAFLKTDMVQLTFQSYREDRVLHQPVEEPVRVDGVLHRLGHCALLYQLCNLEQNVAVSQSVLSQTRIYNSTVFSDIAENLRHGFILYVTIHCAGGQITNAGSGDESKLSVIYSKLPERIKTARS